MKHRTAILIGLCCVITITGLPVIGQPKIADKNTAGSLTFNRISREEVEMLISDVAKTNPKILKLFSEDPEMKKAQLENLRQLLASASQAQKDGLTNDPVNRQELENIRSETVAVNYDKEINKDKGPMPPFGFISENRVKEFWGQTGSDHEAEFQRFLDAKIIMLKRNNPQMKDRETSEEEKTQARAFFAKIEIYEKEFDDRATSGALPKPFREKVDLQVKLQQAQFLARIYSERLADKLKVTDEEVAKYIAEHSEFDTTAKKAKAEEILSRAKAGEDFAALANEFSEDLGNIDPKGKKVGGLYKDVTKGKMVAPFEQIALALKLGQIAPNLVETDFGYHIIKLEKKSEIKDSAGQLVQTYDVRHILISTTYGDPAAPDETGKPVKAYVRSKLETEKEKQLLGKIVADNNIQVPEDFTVSEVAVVKTPKTVKKPPVRKKRVIRKGH